MLFVCTANHCRSPIAEQLFLAMPEFTGPGWTAESAGTLAEPGVAMHPFAAQVLADRGITAPQHWASRRLSVELVTAADLVLTAAPVHRRAVVQLVPRAVGRTFLLRQFARFARELDPGGGPLSTSSYVEAVSATRSVLQPVADGQDDLPDPIGKPVGAFALTARTVQADLDSLAAALTGRRLTAPARPEAAGRVQRGAW